MAPTLPRVASAALSSALLAGARVALDVPVRWVAVSELEDPTPFLEGGELVLTTGMRLTDPGAVRRYVARLVGRGVAGLGFGVGLGHETVPAALVEAATDTACRCWKCPGRRPSSPSARRCRGCWRPSGTRISPGPFRPSVS